MGHELSITYGDLFEENAKWLQDAAGGLEGLYRRNSSRLKQFND